MTYPKAGTMFPPDCLPLSHSPAPGHCAGSCLELDGALAELGTEAAQLLLLVRGRLEELRIQTGGE